MRRHLIFPGILCLLVLVAPYGISHAEAGEGEPGNPTGSVIQVYNGCNAGAEVESLVKTLGEKGFTATKAGRIRETAKTSIYLTPEQASAGQAIATHLPIRPRFLRVRENPQGIRVVVGCDFPKQERSRPQRQAGVIVLNGCNNSALGEGVARKLILEGFNVTRVSNTSEETTPGQSEIHARLIHRKTAERMQRFLPGEQSLETWDDLPEGIEIQVVVGCEQKLD